MTLSEQAAELQRQWERRTDHSAPPIYFILEAIRLLAEANEARATEKPSDDEYDRIGPG